MLVTTSYDPRPEQLELAERLAEQVRAFAEIDEPVRIIPRKRYSLSRLSMLFAQSSILLVSKERIEYYHEQQPVLFFHPSLAAIRVKRLLKGEPDTLIQLSRLQPGDLVLDCTAGLGSDAIVYSFALGGKGEVTALESRALPYLLLQHGLRAYGSNISGMDEAMRRIRVLQADHCHFLQKQPDKSFDVIYFDPMFRKPIQESNSIGAIRQLADPRPVSEETVREAKRVARRTVILKEHRDSKEFERLGFSEVHRSTTKIAYGVIRL